MKLGQNRPIPVCLHSVCDTGTVFLVHAAKAFDGVCMGVLIYRMLIMGILHRLVKVLSSHTLKNYFSVRAVNALSLPRNVKADVVQVSKFGPTCYNVFINNIRQPEEIEINLFANDTAILCSYRPPSAIIVKIASHLNRLERWLIKLKIKVHVEKCHVVYFSWRRIQPEPAKLFKRCIPWQQQIEIHLRQAPHIYEDRSKNSLLE
ncbi:hypothetical protein AVEN_79799-1 [Araneus ventricosus]|uniref:Uncharacterized protein n=1 Tax=Araneus ventricosus TaxID=182803 RepID=A0A4Y2R795_ARAVE|nr:hypothetical protein AVEN_79799-1 [Araneus ventricosus]